MLRFFERTIIGSYAIFKIDLAMCRFFWFGLKGTSNDQLSPFFLFWNGYRQVPDRIGHLYSIQCYFCFMKEIGTIFFRTEARLFGLHHTISNLCRLKLYEFVSFFLGQSTTDYFSLYLCRKKLIRINKKKL